MSKLKKCLVTGASGFIGKPFCVYLKNQGVFVRALFRNPTSGPWDEQVIHDLADPERYSIPETIFDSIDTVFHLAGVAHAGRRSNISPEVYWTVNTASTGELMHLAAKSGVRRFIYFSSTKAINPTDDYGSSKQAAEKLVLELGAKHGLHVCILRPSLVYGPNLKGNLLSMMRGIDRGWFPALPDTQNQRSLISVQDLSRVALLAAKNVKANGKIYTVTDGKNYSTRQLYDSMRQSLGRGRAKISFPLWPLKICARIGDLLRLPLNSESLDKITGSEVHSSELLCEDLNWKPSTNFFQSMPEIVKAYKVDTKGSFN